jgi:3-hydroxy-3-methylglutaryl CoA synthase
VTLDATPPDAATRAARRVARAVESSQSLPNDARLIDLLTIAKAASTSLRTVQSWVSSGKLRVVRIGRVARVRLPDWVAFLEQNVIP